MTLQKLTSSINYEIELITQLAVTIGVAGCYGHIEAKYIPTVNMPPLPAPFEQWSWYHVDMVLLLTISSLGLAWAHAQWMLKGRMNYIWLICAANAIAAPMLEDIAWFVTRGQAIHRNEWTMIRPGWGVNLGVTWVPAWYLVVIAVCVPLYWLADQEAAKAYAAWQQNKAND